MIALDAPTRVAVVRLMLALKASLSKDPPRGPLARLLSQGLIIGPGGISLDRDAGRSVWQDGRHIEGPACCTECDGEFEDTDTSERHPGQVVAVFALLSADMRDPESPEQSEPEARGVCGSCADEWESDLAALEDDA